MDKGREHKQIQFNQHDTIYTAQIPAIISNYATAKEEMSPEEHFSPQTTHPEGLLFQGS